MNKANLRELTKALAWLDMNDATATDVACRTLATIQRAGTPADQRAILAIIKDRGLSHKFYTENHCLVAY
jgi:pyridoxine/pyridoxamine 5'-phosphate oxidase